MFFDKLIEALLNLLIKALHSFGKIAAARIKQQQRRQSILLANTRAHCHGRLCRVRECTDPVRLGVHPAATADEMAGGVQALPPYVRRDAEDQLRALAMAGGLIIIVGAATSGKSRLAYEFMRAWAPDRELIVPTDPDGLRRIVKEAGPRHDVIIWLDGMEPYLTTGGLNATVLDALCPPGRNDVLALGTLRADAYSRLTDPKPDGSAIQASQEVLRGARIIMLDISLSASEQPRAQLLRHDERIANALDQSEGAGFGEYVAAGPMALERWRSSVHGEHAGASAIISAAVDARRAGFRSPLPRVLLEQLHLSYLEPRHRHQADRNHFDSELAWAVEPVNGAIGCLNRVGDDTYEPFGYLVTHVERMSSLRDIPSTLWPELLLGTITHSNNDDVFHVGTSAYLAGQRDTSEEAFHRAASAHHVGAMSNLGFQLHAAGSLDEAEHWYRIAADRGSTSAMANLGFLLHQVGRFHEAEKWFLRGAKNHSVDAMAGLGFLLHQRRRLKDAEEWLRRAAHGGSIEANAGLGLLMQDTGRLDEAGRCYRRAAEAGSVDAMACLGFLYHMTGRYTEAEQWYRRGAAHRGPDAMAGLGFLLHMLGRFESAEQWYRRAAEIGNTITSRALGTLLHARGEFTEAEQCYRRAYQVHDPAAPLLLSVLMDEMGRSTEAERWRRRAAKADPIITSYGLGLLYRSRGELGKAAGSYQRAADAGFPLAIAGLVMLLQDMGRTDEAERWWMRATNPKDASFAGLGMGFLFHPWGRIEGSEDLWSRITGADGDLVISGLGLLLHQIRQPKRTRHEEPLVRQH